MIIKSDFHIVNTDISSLSIVEINTNAYAIVDISSRKLIIDKYITMDPSFSDMQIGPLERVEHKYVYDVIIFFGEYDQCIFVLNEIYNDIVKGLNVCDINELCTR